MPDDNAQAADDTRRLRARFPRWGILFDPLESVWIAVRGKRTLVAASSPEKLTEQVEAAARGEAGPVEVIRPRRGVPFASKGTANRPDGSVPVRLVRSTGLAGAAVRAGAEPRAG